MRCRFLTLMPISATISPEMKSVVPISVDSRMFFSTIFPKNAAPIPRKKMPSENANYTCAFVTGASAVEIYDAIPSEKLVKA